MVVSCGHDKEISDFMKGTELEQLSVYQLHGIVWTVSSNYVYDCTQLGSELIIMCQKLTADKIITFSLPTQKHKR
jgi:hypothetical protein